MDDDGNDGLVAGEGFLKVGAKRFEDVMFYFTFNTYDSGLMFEEVEITFNFGDRIHGIKEKTRGE